MMIWSLFVHQLQSDIDSIILDYLRYCDVDQFIVRFVFEYLLILLRYCDVSFQRLYELFLNNYLYPKGNRTVVVFHYPHSRGVYEANDQNVVHSSRSSF